MLIINVVSLMQKYRIMHNKATTSSNFLLYPVISFLLMFGLLIAGCSDNENEEELPAPDVPDYSTIIVKDIQNMPKNFTFDRVEVKVTGLDWQVIETLIFPYENGQIVQYEGNYDDYLAKRPEDEVVITKTQVEEKKVYEKPKSNKIKMSYNEMREFERIDDDIAKLEEKIEQLEKDIVANSRNFVELNKLTNEKEEAEKQLEQKMDRWVYLNDLNDKILESK